MTDAPAAGWPGRVAIGIVRSDPPQVFLAPNGDTISRVLAVRLVAQTGAADLDAGALEQVRSALQEKDWVEALNLWMLATGDAVDVYPDEEIVDLDDETASLELSVTPLFEQGRD